LHALAAGVKADDLVGKALGKDSLVFPYRFRLKAPVTVTRGLNLYRAILCLELLTHPAVTTVAA